MAHVFKYENVRKYLIYKLFKMRMEDKTYGIKFELGI
jgi:hypothetical protein